MQITLANFSSADVNQRIDAQFFHPQYVESFNKVLSLDNCSLNDIAHISDGNHLKIAEEFNLTDGVRYLRGQDLGTDMMLHDRNIVYIPHSLYKSLARSHIFKGDILITIVGANTGLVGLVFDPPQELVANCKLGIIRADKKKIINGYLYAFLIGQYGQHQILRSIRGGGQTGLILPDIRSLKIPRLSNRLESKINDIVILGHTRITESKSVYNKIQVSFISEINLFNWHPKHKLSFVKKYSDCKHVKRIDAEYFQPKYDEIVDAIKSYSNGFDTLGNLVKIKKCVEVGSEEYLDEGVPFVRVSNLSPFEISEEKYISESLYTELTAKGKQATFETVNNHQPQQGEILFTKDATPGIAYYLNEQPPRMIPSGGILRLKLRDQRVNGEYLTLVLNSMIVKEQINRDVGGSVILHWRPDQVKDTLIPILPRNKQEQIQAKVIESFKLRQQSKQLLECAKRAVEIAIEQDEVAAIEYLKREVGHVAGI